MSNNEEPAGPLRLLLKLDEVNTRIDDWRNGASKPIKGPAHEAHKAGRPVPLSGFLGEALAYWSRARADAAPLFNEAHNFLDKLCSAYLDATPGERAKIREAVASKRSILSLLRDHIGRASQMIQQPSDAHWLRVGLAAASINDLGTDFRDTYLSLGGLYLAAARAGIDPAPHFAEIGEISSHEKGLQNYSTCDFLVRFHQSAFFASSVRPKLKSLQRPM